MRALSQVLKIFLRNAELAENLEEQRRADFPTAVNGNSHGASVRMVPTLVAAGLPRPRKPELAGCILEVAGRAARHVRFRWCRQARECVFPNTLPQSSERRRPTRSVPLRASALGRSNPGWRESLQPMRRLAGGTRRFCSLQASRLALDFVTVYHASVSNRRCGCPCKERPCESFGPHTRS